MIKASSTPGIYKIRQLAQHKQFLASSEKVIAEIEVTGEPKDMALPDTLPTPSREYPLMKPEEVKRIREIEFSGNVPAVINKVVGADFLINNTAYSEREVPTVVNLGDVEEWHLIVGDSHHGGNEGHPFHMHVNSFEVISINGIAQPSGLIQDTIWVPSNSTVVVRVRFKGFVGKAVYHCHILSHEDTGMMQNFLIVDPTSMSHGG
jgi:FtsP/CotA-like multicopper oxidase with cupredoxin domain